MTTPHPVPDVRFRRTAPRPERQQPRPTPEVALTTWFAGLSAAVSADPLLDVAAAVAQQALAVLPGCSAVALSEWRPSRNPTVLAASDAVADRLERLQVRCGEGPTLRALETGVAAVTWELPKQTRWPRVAAAAARLGVHESWCIPVGGAHPVVLTAYSRRPAALAVDAGASPLVATFRTLTAMVLGQAGAQRDAANLQRALESNRRVGIAIGVLMHALHVTDEAAFDLLRSVSQRSNRKLHDIAADVIDTGIVPQDPPPL